MTDEQLNCLARALGMTIGQVGYYFLMRKLGAPKYFAYFASTTTAHLTNIADPIGPKIKEAFSK